VNPQIGNLFLYGHSRRVELLPESHGDFVHADVENVVVGNGEERDPAAVHQLAPVLCDVRPAFVIILTLIGIVLRKRSSSSSSTVAGD
jgi:hypothetical protein